MSGVKFLTQLLITSEKAASVARTCRKNDRLRSLLVEEKGAVKKNACFVADFKTLADVLIQELIRYDLERQVRMLY
jgi:inositol polyphosphate 1-phosphatase